jgi:hypothetical protein
MSLARWFYNCLIYRHHMRFLHKRNRHRREPRRIDGNYYCSWCGHLEAADGTVIVDGIALGKRVAEITGRLA